MICSTREVNILGRTRKEYFGNILGRIRKEGLRGNNLCRLAQILANSTGGRIVCNTDAVESK